MFQTQGETNIFQRLFETGQGVKTNCSRQRIPCIDYSACKKVLTSIALAHLALYMCSLQDHDDLLRVWEDRLEIKRPSTFTSISPENPDASAWRGISKLINLKESYNAQNPRSSRLSKTVTATCKAFPPKSNIGHATEPLIMNCL